MPTQVARAAPPLVLPFAAIREEHAPLVGRKAAALAMLRAAGLPVPDGFCLTTEAMRLFIREGEGLAERLATIEKQATEGRLSLAESWSYLGETRKVICATEIPRLLREGIRLAYEKGLGDGPVAVRSSGTREDLEGASFAGQYETLLNVAGTANLEDAIRRCWASIWRNRVLQYSARKAGGTRDLAMGVIVQRLVRAEAAGVLFTVNPLTGRDGEMLVEACPGLGEALVAGKVNPDRFVVDARSGKTLSAEIAEKKLKTALLEAGTHDVEIAESDRRRPALEGFDLAQLAKLGGAIAELNGWPTDIEWGREGGVFHVLQARPITRLSFAPDFGEWTNANFKDGGVASDVVTPFMASLYDWIFTETMNRHWREIRLLPRDREVDWFAVHYARPYWNVGEVKRCLLAVPGFVERDFDADLGLAIEYEGPGRTTPFSVGRALAALPTLFAVRRLYRERLAAAKAFVPKFAEEFAVWDAERPEMLPDPVLASGFEKIVRDLYHRTESAYFLTVYSLSMAKIDFKVLFDRLDARAGGCFSYLALVSGLRDVSHLRPYVELYRLARAGSGEDPGRGAAAAPDLAAFLKRWQHHGTRELDITVPRWGEDPRFIEEMLARYREGAAEDPAAAAERQTRLYEAERAKVEEFLRSRVGLRLRPWIGRAFFRGLDRMREYTWWREEMRDCSTRVYWLIRRWALEVGRRLKMRGQLARADDVFLLPFERAIALAKGTLAAAEAREEINWAKRYRARFRNFQNPNELGVAHRYRAPRPEPDPAVRMVRGVPGASGVRRGQAKVVRRLEEAKKVERGDVLVTVFTDPGWTPLLSIVSAIVTETGGLLSHTAVISREYGIPAVLAATGAASAIRDGDEVLVDGDRGTVEIVGERRRSPEPP